MEQENKENTNIEDEANKTEASALKKSETQASTGTEKAALKSSTASKVAVFFSGLALGVAIFTPILFYYNLEHQISKLEQKNQDLESAVSQAINENRRIYVFDMDRTVQSMGLQEASQKFETDIAALNEQVKAAKDKIKNLKDDKVKADVSDMYLASLQMKRDELINAYAAARQKSLDSINSSLAEMATELNIPTIFINKSVMVNTNYVIDVTPQIVEKVKAKMQN